MTDQTMAAITQAAWGEAPVRVTQFRQNDCRQGVDIALTHTRTSRRVYWDRIGNSYVAVQHGAGQFLVDGIRCSILSINGAGEVRWSVTPGTSDARDNAAARHFDAVELSPYAEEAR